MVSGIRIQEDRIGVLQKLFQINWGLVLLLTAIASVGFASLYSAGGGSFEPWASRQMVRFAVCVGLMVGVAMVDIRLWYRLAYPVYAIGFMLLVIVDVKGHIGMGAQRWINLGFMQLQPSELMKIAVVLALARYFHNTALEDVRRIRFLILPALIVFAPVGLVMMQPDLGTAITIIIGGGTMFFMAGVPLWMFGAVIALVLAALPVGWGMLHDYQRQRVLTFMDPESDPLGSGYHITQSKIALGSGGIEGKGFLMGTQSHLNFLPEKQTDFIFTLWAEEWGLTGGLFLLGLYGLTFLYGIWISFRCRPSFARMLALGLTVNFSLYVLINTGMVMGLLPVVGVPLPLVSYGGTAMLSTLIGFGLVMSCNIHRDVKMVRV